MRPALKLLIPVLVVAACASVALAQGTPPRPAAVKTGLWPLFVKSFDFFTVLLLAGSGRGRRGHLRLHDRGPREEHRPPRRIGRLRDLARALTVGKTCAKTCTGTSPLVGRVLRATLASFSLRQDRGFARRRASWPRQKESARWFRKIDVLSVIGNLGPLVGLAGTVYGMILAFKHPWAMT